MTECRSRMSTSVSTLISKSFYLRLLVILQRHITCLDKARNTTGKHHSLIGVLKFVSTDKYIQTIFISFETDVYNFIFIG
jgi:hypothetical protein